MSDYIPSGDSAFNQFATVFVGYAVQHPTDLGLSTELANSLDDVYSNRWIVDFPNHLQKQAAAQAATTKKDEARAALEGVIRRVAMIVQNNPNVSDDVRRLMMLPVRDNTPTPAPVPATAPVVIKVDIQPLRHVLNFRDATTPDSRRKPAGVAGAEIWLHVGTAEPSSPAQMRLIAIDSTPHLVEFDGADAGKTAYYRLRWKNTRGQMGPWSELANASIAG